MPVRDHGRMRDRSKADRAVLQRLGDAFAKRRRAAGKSRLDVEEASGVTERFLGSLERGSANPSFLTLLKLAKALDVRLDDLVREAL